MTKTTQILLGVLATIVVALVIGNLLLKSYIAKERKKEAEARVLEQQFEQWDQNHAKLTKQWDEIKAGMDHKGAVQ